jgi:hypothetical protein
VLQLAPDSALLLEPPDTLAEHTDISRRGLRAPHFGQATVLPFSPIRHSRSNR